MHRNLRLLAIGAGVRTFGAAIYSPFLALFLQSDLGIGYLEIGALFVLVGTIQLPFNFVGGLLTDRIGRRRLVLLGLAGEAIATLALAYAFYLRSLDGAIAAATVGGILTTLAGPASAAYVADFAEGSERTRGFTWLRIGFNAGYSGGVTLGGILAAVVGYARSVAVAGGVIAAATVGLSLALGPSPFDRELEASRAVRPKSADPAGDPPPRPKRSLAESVRVLARDRPALEVLLAIVFTSVVIGQWTVTYPLFVRNVLGVSVAILGVGLALNGLIVVFGQQPTTERMLGRRHTTIAILGLVLYVAAFLGLGLAGLVGFFPLAVFFVSVAVLTVGENLVTIPQSTLPSNLAPRDEVGAYNGAFALVGAAGALVAIFVGGLALATVSNPFVLWVFLTAPAVVAIVLFRDAARRIPATVDRA